MKSRIFLVLWLVAVQVAERGIPRSWPDALALLVLVLRARATRPCTAIDAVGSTTRSATSSATPATRSIATR